MNTHRMKKSRGFRLRVHKLVKIFKWIVRPRREPVRYKRLESPAARTYNPISKFFTLARSLRRGAKQLCFPNSGYMRVGQAPEEGKPVVVPKGHMAVYVGESDDDTQRYLVPVIYFNHPLFGELLKEAEKVYGFNHPGRIVIPCGASEFEKVQMRIAAGDHCQWRRRNSNRRY
ncbi:putative small auxin-up RNA [Rosa chinensis]|uniref:Putative small auxin-up RNA n=1 Tax=Rosa chinensis TaxID=74649 RepID=A0A2P6P831_ROSCH|nr:auxin-responsive protein SAUR36 [Rosa chinensis]PRQ18098.1 putative small auxin-up RNA [Rosa chinensis]